MTDSIVFLRRCVKKETSEVKMPPCEDLENVPGLPMAIEKVDFPGKFGFLRVWILKNAT